jgi:hypothetical protein
VALVATALLALAVEPVRESPVSAARGSAAAAAPRTAPALIGGVKLQSARCAQWAGASAAEKSAVVDVLGNVVGGPTPYGRASSLSRSEAFALFDRACAQRFASGFLLYELYTRASAFHAVPFAR